MISERGHPARPAGCLRSSQGSVGVQLARGQTRAARARQSAAYGSVTLTCMPLRAELGQFRIADQMVETTHSIIWLAHDESGNEVVVKELKTRKVDREPYLRFRDEVAFHARGPHPGVLPVLEASVPGVPTRRMPAWLAMPLATTVTAALGEAPSLDEVVDTVASYASTLAALAQEGIFHRDLKPANLFRYAGQWVVGDFGLVTWPGKQELTEPGQKLGPANFIAPEMVIDPTAADPGPADVWSLAKTLWVLAVGQNYPPPGQVRVDHPYTRLRDHSLHPRAAGLEPILEQATRPDPLSRPTMDTLAAELRAWMAQPLPRPSLPDVDDLAERVRAIAEPTVRASDERGRILRDASRLLAHLRRAPRELELRMRKLGNLLADQQGLILHLGGGTDRRDAIAIATESSTISAPGPHGVSLSLDIAYELFEPGQIRLVAGLYVHTAPANPEVIWLETRDAPNGTSLAANGADELAQAAIEHFASAATRYVELVEHAEAVAQKDRQLPLCSTGTNYEFRTEPQAGVLVIHRKSDGSRDGSRRRLAQSGHRRDAGRRRPSLGEIG
jgi:serine/threonine protein kinase